MLYEWHASKRSEAAVDTLFNPLSAYFDFDIHSIDWRDVLQNPDTSGSGPQPVYFYVPPPFEFVRRFDRQVVWIPMWDSARHYSYFYWRRVPRNIRIVAFSAALARRARAAGLEVLQLQYFSNPDTLSPVQWGRERIAFYWNRTGLVSPEFLRHWCAALRVDRLLFKPDLDPFIDQRAFFTLPDRMGDTKVEVIPHTKRREDYFRLTAPANIFLAPRSHEGIGLTFIEALARGCAVFAFDGATMNEYVQHGLTGFLFSSRTSLLKRAPKRIQDKLANHGIQVGSPPFLNYLRDSQPWKALERLDVESLGQRAREEHKRGYAQWLDRMPSYAAFLAGK